MLTNRMNNQIQGQDKKQTFYPAPDCILNHAPLQSIDHTINISGNIPAAAINSALSNKTTISLRNILFCYLDLLYCAVLTIYLPACGILLICTNPYIIGLSFFQLLYGLRSLRCIDNLFTLGELRIGRLCDLISLCPGYL